MAKLHEKKNRRTMRGAVRWLLIAAALLTALCPSRRAGAAEAQTAEELSAQCKFVAPKKEKAQKYLRDDSPKTAAEIPEGDEIRILWDAPVQGVYLEWNAAPSAFTLISLGDGQEELRRETFDAPLLNRFYPVAEDVRGVCIPAEEALSLSTLHVYGAGALPESIHDWSPAAQACDLLLISAHCDDELLYFGGTIPTYAGERGDTVQLCYMAQGNRLRMNEAMNGLWLCGVRNEPIFLGLRDKYSESLETAERQWGRDTVVQRLVEVIRQTRPQVIITHDLEGEYGHGAHRMTASCVVEAVQLAADASQDTASAQRYGAWQAKKLYLHLGQEKPVLMDWRVPLDAFAGKTALEMANEAYLCHVSQLEYHTAVHDSGDDNCAAFGLAFTTVGPDSGEPDFLNNIPPEDLTNYIPPTPSPSPTPEPTAEPTALPAASTPLPQQPQDAGRPSWIIPVAVMCAAAVATVLIVRKRKKK